MVVPKLADSPEVSKKFATGHKIHDHIETTIVLQEIVGEHDEVISSKQTQTDCPQYKKYTNTLCTYLEVCIEVYQEWKVDCMQNLLFIKRMLYLLQTDDL